jgi:hypothetical protein
MSSWPSYRHYADDDGKEKIVNPHLELPPDLANGMIFTLLKNLRPEELPTKNDAGGLDP